jgi:hypothetical protein
MLTAEFVKLILLVVFTQQDASNNLLVCQRVQYVFCEAWNIIFKSYSEEFQETVNSLTIFFALLIT